METKNNLNSEQQRAAEHKLGPLLIMAGAGAGKTKTVTCRIKNLIVSGVAPDKILAVTFTNKAAREMRERVLHLLGINPATERAGLWALAENPNIPFVATFHALGVYMLRKHGSFINLPNSFTILDKDDQTKLIKAAIKKNDLDPKQWDPRKIAGAISKQKGAGISVEEFQSLMHSDFFRQTAGAVWEDYEKSLQAQKALDFDDLLLKTIELLNVPEVREYYQNRFEYIHIDEYQDTNTAQYKIAKTLAAKNKNICVVGDIDQSIYSWRGADFRNILNFETDYPDATVVTLEENYRSTKTVLAAANSVIIKNKERKAKNLFTQNGVGEPIGLISGFDEGEEAYLVTQSISNLIASGVSPNEIAILYRANFQSRVLEEACLRNDIPYKVLGVRFFDRKEVKDLIAFLRAAQNESDVEAFRRVTEAVPCGVGKTTLAKLFTTGYDSLPAAAKAKIKPLQETLKSLREAMQTVSPSVLVKMALSKSGIEQRLKNGTDEDVERLENIRELVSLATKYDSVAAPEGVNAFMTDVALMSADEETGDNKPSVRMMTVHAAKGLEFDYVFITGLEQDLFPHLRMGDEGADVDTEEERRLFYVALTRARKKLFLCYAQMRTIFGSKRNNLPSNFIFDIPEELFDTAAMPGAPSTNWITID